MVTNTKPTIEEQITFLNQEQMKATCIKGVNPDYVAMFKLASDSLKELAAIKSQPVPVEPEIYWIPYHQFRIEDGTHPMVDLQDYRNLQSALQEAEKREKSKHQQYAALLERHTKLAEQLQVAQPVPVEPYKITVMRTYSEQHGEVLAYIDSLQSALQAAQERGDEYRDNGQRLLEAADGWKLCAVKAEADNLRLRKDCDEHARWRADLADKLHDTEASNRRLVELLKEPTPAMYDALTDRMWKDHTSSTVWKAMSAELLREVGK